MKLSRWQRGVLAFVFMWIAGLFAYGLDENSVAIACLAAMIAILAAAGAGTRGMWSLALLPVVGFCFYLEYQTHTNDHLYPFLVFLGLWLWLALPSLVDVVAAAGATLADDFGPEPR